MGIRSLIVVLLVACKAPEIKPQKRVIWSFEFNQCFCQMYDLNKIQPLEDATECAIENCDDLVGFSADAWARDITPWGRELRRWGEDECQ